eukprot:366271-Chlamydomonas_euryale.AAC.5
MQAAHCLLLRAKRARMLRRPRCAAGTSHKKSFLKWYAKLSGEEAGGGGGGGGGGRQIRVQGGRGVGDRLFRFCTFCLGFARAA